MFVFSLVFVMWIFRYLVVATKIEKYLDRTAFEILNLYSLKRMVFYATLFSWTRPACVVGRVERHSFFPLPEEIRVLFF